MGSVAMSYMRKDFLILYIYEEMRKYLTLYEEADPFWIPSIWGKFSFLFIPVMKVEKGFINTYKLVLKS